MDDHNQESAMQKFEDLATRLFSIVKEDVEKAEEVADLIARTSAEPQPIRGHAIPFGQRSRIAYSWAR